MRIVLRSVIDDTDHFCIVSYLSANLINFSGYYISFYPNNVVNNNFCASKNPSGQIIIAVCFQHDLVSSVDQD